MGQKPQRWRSGAWQPPPRPSVTSTADTPLSPDHLGLQSPKGPVSEQVSTSLPLERTRCSTPREPTVAEHLPGTPGRCPVARLQLKPACPRLPCPHRGPAMPRKSLEQVYGQTGRNSISLRRAWLTTVIILEGTGFRPTREGWLCLLLPQSRPQLPPHGPTSHVLGQTPAHDGSGQSLENLGKLPGIYTWEWASLGLLGTPASHCPGSVRLSHPSLGWGPSCPVFPGSMCHWRPDPQPISDQQTGLISAG